MARVMKWLSYTYMRWICLPQRSTMFSERAANACAMATKTFLENGAKASESTCYEVQVELPSEYFEPPNQESNPESKSEAEAPVYIESPVHLTYHAHYRFFKEVTPLFIIQKRLSNATCCGDLEKFCVAQGGDSLSRVTHIAVNNGDKQPISYAQCKKFVVAFYKYASSGLPLDLDKTQCLTMIRRLEKLYDEVVNGYEDSSSQDSSDDEPTPDSINTVGVRPPFYNGHRQAIRWEYDMMKYCRGLEWSTAQFRGACWYSGGSQGIGCQE